MSPRGVLIVIEGIDGGGKTTLQHGLADWLRSEGREVVTTKEPTDGPIGRRIRAVAAKGRGTLTAEEELALFHEDRRIHVAEVVRPALGRGAVVVQDRSYFSTVAYQGQRGLDRAELLRASTAIAPVPDLLLVVDLPASSALERILARGGATDDFERLESLEALREVFVGFAGAVILDGAGAPEDVLASAKTAAAAILD